jgi:glycosyltransferase involved in cell wall biosynthesis
VRVLQTMAGADYGGAEAFFVRLALALHRAGLDQRIVIRENPRRAQALRRGGVEPVELAFGGKLDFATSRRLKAVARDYKPHIVLSWMNRASAITPVGDWVTVGRQGGYYDLKYYKNCRHLIGNTQDIVDSIVAQGWPKDRAHYLPNFVAADVAAPVARGGEFTPETAPLAVALGRLHENKAFDTLLDAVARVPGLYLWLAGEGPERAALEAQAEKLGIRPRVRFLGWREDADALIAAADVFVCPSRHEPLGNVVLEAWAQGVPVVAADALGPGTLIDHGRTGLLAPVDDAPALARAIRTVAEDPDLRAALGAAGRAAFEADFTEGAVVKRYLDFFQSLVG